MSQNFNLPNGTLLSDISADECPTCEGYGEVERTVIGEDEEDALKNVPCPECSGLGVVNTRAKR